MKARPVHRLLRAEEDLVEIWLYLSTERASAADRILDRIELRSQQLALFPHSGVAREEVGPGIRQLVVGNYLIFYRIADAAIEVLRVLHGHRDIQPEDFQP